MTQATALAPSMWEVNFSRAFYSFYYERAWRDAGIFFQRAIAINPHSSISQAYYSMFLAAEGRAEDSVNCMARACRLDPLSPYIHGLSATALLALGRFERAEHAARQALELQPEYLFGLWTHGLALLGLNRNQEGVDALERAACLSRAPMFVGILGLAYARSGRVDEADLLMRDLEDRTRRGEYVPAFATLCIFIGKKDLPAIRDGMSKALGESTPPYTLLVTCTPFLEGFRQDPDIQRIHLELCGW